MSLEIDQGTTLEGGGARRRQNKADRDVESMEACASNYDATSMAASSSEGEHDSKRSKETATQALQSIRYCCKMCFVSVSADIFITVIDDDMRSKFVTRARPLGRADFITLSSRLTLLLFGVGLRRTSRLHSRMIEDVGRRMNGDALKELFRTLSWIWGIVAAHYSILCLCSAGTLPVHGRDGYFGFLFEGVSSTQASLALTFILVVGHVVVRHRCRETAAAELEKYNKKTGTRRRRKNSTARWKAGYRAYVVQAHCAGTSFLFASLELVKWIASFNLSVAFDHALSVYDFVTPFTISALLLRLNKSLLCASVAEARGDPANIATHDQIVRRDLFLAGIGYYDRLASTINWATAFRLLPYVTAPMVPYLLRAAKRISPSLLAKVVDSFGIQM